ncbi:MAG: ABC transporter substrate-binding protein [Salinarimonas sp.]|nr:ABC transporter substrate-binding protein [Salinarimonas sp.]
MGGICVRLINRPARQWLAGIASAALLFAPTMVDAQSEAPVALDDWDAIVAAAEGQTVYWNAWAGDEKGNAFIAWVGDQVRERYGVRVEHVKLTDTAEAVSRVVSERAAGRDTGGTVDLIWINGANFVTMKDQGLLFGPFTQALPNFALVDEENPSNLIDFTVPVDGMAAPWRVAQLAFVYDSDRVDRDSLPGSIPAMLDWARANPGLLTHPNARNFLGATFLKQALHALAPDTSVLYAEATDETYEEATAPLWEWYEEIRPHFWRGGAEFPGSSADLDRLLDDGEIEIAVTLNPATAALLSETGLLPESARVYFLDDGTIGNTSFVSIPYNAANKEGAMVVSNFLMSPLAQARAQDPTVLGAFTVLDMDALDADERALFEEASAHPAMPGPDDIADVQMESHPSWMTRLTEDWEARTTR